MSVQWKVWCIRELTIQNHSNSNSGDHCGFQPGSRPADVADRRAHAALTLSRRAAHLEPEATGVAQLPHVVQRAGTNVLEA